MELIENLFVGGNVSDLETIVYSLRREVPVLRLYCIVYFEDKNRLELLSSHELFHTRNKKPPCENCRHCHGQRGDSGFTSFYGGKKRRRRGEILPIQGS